MTTEQATFAGGCFWCIEAAFKEVPGVRDVVSGYAGGETDDPTYEAVCTGETGHAEAVQVTYDPDRTGFEDLLELFFRIHDPTTLNREGPDVGSQYRSAVFTHSAEQAALTREYIDELEATGRHEGIVTEVEPLEAFHRAEESHQDFFEKHPENAYCQVHALPKVKSARGFTPE